MPTMSAKAPSRLLPVAGNLRPRPPPLGYPASIAKATPESLSPREAQEESTPRRTARPRRGRASGRIGRGKKCRAPRAQIGLALRVSSRDEIDPGRKAQLRAGDVPEIDDVDAPRDHPFITPAPPRDPSPDPQGHDDADLLEVSAVSLAGFTTAALSGRSRRNMISSASTVRRISRT